MKFKRLIEEQNRLECLKTKEELTDYGLEMLAELNQALQLLQTDVSISLVRAKKYARHQHFLGTQGKELVEFEDWKQD